MYLQVRFYEKKKTSRISLGKEIYHELIGIECFFRFHLQIID